MPVPNFFKNLIKLASYIFVGVFSLFTSFFVMFLVLIALAAGLAVGSVDTYTTDLDLEHHAGTPDAESRFVSLPINGLILGERDELPSYMELLSDLGITYGYEVKENLRILAENDEIEGVILEIHSPGGTIYGTAAIADGIDYYRNMTGKPVLAYVGSTAASGSYWAAVGADEIVADHGTMIGSIGVIAGPFKYYDGVMEEDGGLLGTGVTTSNGIETEYITAGRSKDLGNPYRPLTAEERNTLQQSVDNSYLKFVDYVASNRGLEAEFLREEIGALIFDEVQALDLGLIDAISSKDDAYVRLATLADVSEFEILRPRSAGSFWSAFTGVLLPNFNAKSSKNLPAFCTERMAVLVYSGDVAALCQ